MTKDRLQIDGIDFTGCTENLDNFEVEYGENESTKTVAYMTGTTLTLTREAHDYLKAKHFPPDCSGQQQISQISVYKHCCDITYRFEATYESVQLCKDGCTVNLNLKRIEDADRCYKYLEKTIWFRGGYIESRASTIPVVWYCSQPGFLHWVLLFLQPIINAILIAIEAFAFIANAFGTVINWLFGGPSSEDVCRRTLFGYFLNLQQTRPELNITDQERSDALNDICEGVRSCAEVLPRFYPELSPEQIAEECNRLNNLFDLDITAPPETSIDTSLLCKFQRFLTGCGKRVPTPLIRDILEYHAEACGLKLKSSIFQGGIYRNTVVFGLQYERGVYDLGRAWIPQWIEENGFNLTITQLLEKLKSVWNLDYKIIGDTLCVERRDYFDFTRKPLFDAELFFQRDMLESDYCIEYIQQNACAYGRFEYSRDAQDYQGNRLSLQYNDIIEWNAENADWKDGECTNTVEFSPARFMFDYKTYNNDSGFLGFNFDKEIDNYRDGNFFAGLFGCGETGAIRQRDLIIHDDSSSQLKLLVWDGVNIDSADTIRRVGGMVGGDTWYDYNYPMYFDQNYEVPELYQSFHYIDDPNNRSRRRVLSISDITIPLDCELIDKINLEPIGYYVVTEFGKAIPESVVVIFDGDESKISFTNLEIICS